MPRDQDGVRPALGHRVGVSPAAARGAVVEAPLIIGRQRPVAAGALGLPPAVIEERRSSASSGRVALKRERADGAPSHRVRPVIHSHDFDDAR
jgi:hypothetical protein